MACGAGGNQARVRRSRAHLQNAEVKADARRPHPLMEVNQKKDSEK
jgi:hypothetical protein